MVHIQHGEKPRILGFFFYNLILTSVPFKKGKVMKTTPDPVTVSEEFTREGLKAYVEKYIDIDSYSDESFYELCEEFNYRLHLKANELSELLDMVGIRFAWNINFGTLQYDPESAFADYKYKDSNRRLWKGEDAILAFLRDDVNVEAVIDNYWTARDRQSRWGVVFSA